MLSPHKLKISIGYQELAEKMGFKERRGRELKISGFGNDDSLGALYPLSLKVDKWLNDSRWEKVKNDLGTEDVSL